MDITCGGQIGRFCTEKKLLSLRLARNLTKDLLVAHIPCLHVPCMKHGRSLVPEAPDEKDGEVEQAVF